jgi:hydroxymethylpyrimidine/phosphomethylpyrimidine kinase
MGETSTPPLPAITSPEAPPACVLVFNCGDPSGAGGIAADVTAIASVGAHALPVLSGALARDSSQIFDFFALDGEALSEQARAVLEDIEIQSIKLGFVGTPENLGVVANIASDYPEIPLVAYMPDLSWWNVEQIESYHEAFEDLVLPQTGILIGNYSTLWRWLLPSWSGERNPSARDIALAAGSHGVSYTIVTGISGSDASIENVLTSAQSTLASEKFPRQEASFSGAGDTLSAALAALLASGCELPAGFSEALSYLDRSLEAAFRPGMGNKIPDRLFWAQPDPTDPDSLSPPEPDLPDPSPHDTHH